MLNFKKVVVIISTTLLLIPNAITEELNPSINYMSSGKSVTPWEFSLQFGKYLLEDGKAATRKNSLVATSSTRNTPNDTVNLKWTPKGIKNQWDSVNTAVSTVNITNKNNHIDLLPVKDNAALVFDVKVKRAPNKNVDLTMECNWDWKCRSTISLKSALKNIPKNEWVTLPIPLKCFETGNFDFSKVTTTFMMQTTGKMEIELGDVRLAAFPPEQINC